MQGQGFCFGLAEDISELMVLSQNSEQVDWVVYNPSYSSSEISGIECEVESG